MQLRVGKENSRVRELSNDPACVKCRLFVLFSLLFLRYYIRRLCDNIYSHVLFIHTHTIRVFSF